MVEAAATDLVAREHFTVNDEVVAQRGATWTRNVFVAALAMSSFLLFSLELLAGRLVLPVFGGAPAVWATALCFFTGVLFVGYLYAHLSVQRLGPRYGPPVHLVLAVVLLAVSFLAPTSLAGLRWAGVPEAVNVLAVLVLVAGPQAFLLGATTPLLSAWFAGTQRDAWWLYAASNAASLGALLAYPFLLEPALPLSTQHVALLLGMAVFVGLLAAIVLDVRRRTPATAVVNEATQTSTEVKPVTRRRQLWWLASGFVPAGLLTATTTFLTTDLVSAPLIWVGPLAIYLASFVVAFSARGRRFLPLVERMVPAAVTLLWLPFVAPVGWPVVPLVVTVLGSFAVLAIAIHGRMAEDRPDSAHLTQFYLILSAAGVMATALVGVIAPMLLPDIYEYPALVVASAMVFALRRGNTRLDARIANLIPALMGTIRRVAPYVAVGALLVFFAGRFDAGVLALLGVGGLVVVFAVTPRILAVATPVVLVVAFLVLSANPGATELLEARSFFGVSKVVHSGTTNFLYSGTTLHGVQFTDARASQPTTYYVRSGPVGDVFADLRARVNGPASIGVVGLGGGTLAAYGQTGDSMSFFEIDPLVIAIASDPNYFTYLRDTPATVRTVEGDGRLTLQSQPDGSLDLLVLDAFSSDAVPPHLLTREAVAGYLRTLKPGGAMAFNLSNRYYDLATAVGATAASLGLAAVERVYVPDQAAIDATHATQSIWVVVGPTAVTDRFTAPGWEPVPSGGPVLTDDYPDITRVLRWR